MKRKATDTRAFARQWERERTQAKARKAYYERHDEKLRQFERIVRETPLAKEPETR